MITRRKVVAGLCLLATIKSGRAQSFPVGLVRIVVPFPPGGTTDVLARLLGSGLQSLWNESVIVDNRPGAAGVIGTRQVMTAAADGQTLLMASTGAILALASSEPEPFEIVHDLAPISLVSAPPYLLVVNPALAITTAAELIAYAKANPGKLTYGSSGVGSASHLSGALFVSMADISMLHVPYRGTGPAVTDLIAGRIQVMFSPAPTVAPHIAAGSLRVLGTTGATRSALFPKDPTIAETGLPGYSSLGWFGLFAPSKTYRGLLAKIGADVTQVLLLPESRKQFAVEGAEPQPSSAEDFATFVNDDVEKWLELARATGIKLGSS
jgi:tripartite-type tricarboxylate transporter receptor subunit TctC